MAIEYSGSKEPGVRYELSQPSGAKSYLIPIAKTSTSKNLFYRLIQLFIATFGNFSCNFAYF